MHIGWPWKWRIIGIGPLYIGPLVNRTPSIEDPQYVGPLVYWILSKEGGQQWVRFGAGGLFWPCYARFLCVVSSTLCKRAFRKFDQKEEFSSKTANCIEIWGKPQPENVMKLQTAHQTAFKCGFKRGLWIWYLWNAVLSAVCGFISFSGFRWEFLFLVKFSESSFAKGRRNHI